MLNKTKTRNFTEGPMFFRIFLFALPIMATGVLQILYNMADNIVVGQFSGDPNALGAVGSTTSFSNLMLALIIGIAAGTGVVVAQCYGARRDNDVSRAVHTALLFSLIAGVALALIGLIISRPALDFIGTQDKLLESATLYFRIICLGLPASSVYNFASSILRSTGDSKTPLFILTATGIINVVLNLVFVICFGMSVAGVALATIIAQYLSAVSAIFVLARKRGAPYQFSFKKICFDKALFSRILRIGIPSGIQSSLFSISNVVITNGINSFGIESYITAYTITNNIDAITYTSCNSFYQAAMTFTGQNYGALKHKRIRKTLLYSLFWVTVVGILISQLELLFSDQLINLYISKDAENKLLVMDKAKEMLQLMLTFYFLCGVMEVIMGVLRGLGYSISPMIISLTGACVFRIFWRYVFFPLEKLNSLTGLLLSYPLSWTITIIALIVLFLFAWIRLKKIFDNIA
ncbi:MAG: MATE family efflux transporter [Clostridia bacterium]|nr:MATE family efflux transporter [Clostridia bacterium]